MLRHLTCMFTCLERSHSFHRIYPSLAVALLAGCCREPQEQLVRQLRKCHSLYLLMIAFKLKFEILLRKQDLFLCESTQLFNFLINGLTVMAKCLSVRTKDLPLIFNSTFFLLYSIHREKQNISPPMLQTQTIFQAVLQSQCLLG